MSFDFYDDFNNDFNDGFDDISLDNYDIKDFESDTDKKKPRTSKKDPRRAQQRKKARRKKLVARRVTIVTIMLLTLVLIITGIVVGVKALFSIGDNKVEETVAATVAPTEPEVTYTFDEPDVPFDKKKEGYFSSANSGVYIYDKAAYELFLGDDTTAKRYADCISDFKTLVGDSMTVYNMVVPSHIEFSVPKKITQSEDVKSNSQTKNLKAIYEGYSEDVIGINCYNELSEHFKEYLYFNTDYHWTGLGAYYGYKAFCEQTDQRVLNLSVCTENTIEGYEGSMLYCDTGLYENLDTVYFWTFPYSTYAMRTDSMRQTPYETSVYFEGETSGPYSFGVFIWGDCPLFVEYNKDITNEKKILVVKDSFGNPMVPYLTANYQEVHIIDYRYYEGNLKKYAQENDIKEILFVNGISNANSQSQVDAISTLY